jgi:hypothetical protein
MMAMTEKVFYVGTQGPDPAGLKLGIGWLEAEVCHRGQRVAWLVAASKAAVARGPVAALLGRTTAAALAAGQAVPVCRGLQLRLATERELAAARPAGTVLALYPSARLLAKLAALPRVEAIAAVPWARPAAPATGG